MRAPNLCYVILHGDRRVHRERRAWHPDYARRETFSETTCFVVTTPDSRVSRHVRIDAALRVSARRAGPGEGSSTCRGCLPYREDAR